MENMVDFSFILIGWLLAQTGVLHFQKRNALVERLDLLKALYEEVKYNTSVIIVGRAPGKRINFASTTFKNASEKFGFIDSLTLELVLNHYGMVDTYSKSLGNFFEISNLLLSTSGGEINEVAQDHLNNFKNNSEFQIGLIKTSGKAIIPLLLKEIDQILNNKYFLIRGRVNEINEEEKTTDQ